MAPAKKFLARMSIRSTMIAALAVTGLQPASATASSTVGPPGPTPAATSAPSRPAALADVVGNDWRIDRLTTAAATWDTVTNAHIRMPPNGQVYGSLGCNSFFSHVTMNGTQLTFGELTTTRMLCAQNERAFEVALSNILSHHTFTAQADGGKLTLVADNGNLIHLSRGPLAHVTGVQWQVNTLTTHGVSRRPITSAHISINTGAHQARGDLGCMTAFSAPVTARGEQITFGRLSTSDVPCKGPDRTFRNALHGTLHEHTFTTELHNGNLTLTGTDGDRIILNPSA
ncbi:META domain-containing protein [Streptomyces sp. L2]|uniref:META domain-containing protein n=1 Tax=Streptomyces sp. L2 TaxID=2162665 RepID=UPI0010138683|nr:META domain-containing protein [Streptomyces sp. L2]